MCGRYGFAPQGQDLFRRFGLSETKILIKDRYNVSPGNEMPVIFGFPDRVMRFFKWGLVPSWAKDESAGFRTINARSENIPSKPSFRDSFRFRRCIVPATGFFEWEKTPSGKIPFLIKPKNEALFSFAGLYDYWQGPDGRTLGSFTIITVPANSKVALIHDRMPSILNRDSEKLWLDDKTPPSRLLSQLMPLPDELTEMVRVSPLVNSRVDGPDVLKPYQGPAQEKLI